MDKMLAGELYDPMDSELVCARMRARDLCQELNATRESQIDERRTLLKADRNRPGRVGRRLCDHLSGAANRHRVGHRGWQRCHSGRARFGLRRRQSLPGDSRNHH